MPSAERAPGAVRTRGYVRPLDEGFESELEYFRLAEAIYPDGTYDLFLLTGTPEGIYIWRKVECPHQEFLTIGRH